MKSLIIYYSYGGNTKELAEMIQIKTGSDIIRIETVVPYGMLHDLICRHCSRQEMDLCQAMQKVLHSRIFRPATAEAYDSVTSKKQVCYKILITLYNLSPDFLCNLLNELKLSPLLFLCNLIAYLT